MSKFASGAHVAEERSASGSTFSGKLHFLKVQDGESKILRFLTDQEEDKAYPWVSSWITVEQHQMVPTKQRPAEFPGENWPKTMGTVCRKTELAPPPGEKRGKPMFDDCYICDEMRLENGKPLKRSARMWALACVREQVIKDGKRLGYRDATREVDAIGPDGKPTGAKTKERDIVIINMAWGNFFSPLNQIATYQGSGTICDRDYVVLRKGEGLKTEYTFIALDAIPGNDIRQPHLFGRYCGIDDDTLAQWKEDPNTVPANVASLLKLPVDLVSEVEKRASEEFYARWIDPNKTVEWSGGGDSEGSSNGHSVPAADPKESADRLSAISERLKGYGSNEPDAATDAVPAGAGPADLG